MSARRNLWLFLPYQIASLEGLSQGLYLVWLLQWKHLAPAVAALILGAGSVALTLLEVPTGVLADRFGHRRSLIAGSVAQVVGIALFWLGATPWTLTAGSLAVALGDALRSGADAALLYESCHSLDRAGDFEPLYARAQAAATAVMALLTLAGGWLADAAGVTATWASEVGLCGLGLLLALSIVAPPRAPVDPADEPVRPRWPGREQVATIIAPAAIAGVLLGCFELLVQATWPIGRPLVGLTAIVAGSLLAESLGGLIASGRGRGVALGALGLAALGVAALGAWLPVAAFWLMAVLRGWSMPIRADAIQRLAHPRERAQAESWAGLIDMAALALLLPLAAAAYPRVGEGWAVATVAVPCAGAWLASALRRRYSVRL